MVKIVPSHPHLVADYQDEILESVDDADVSIRMRALELASAMVGCFRLASKTFNWRLRGTSIFTGQPDNVREIVSQLLSHLVPPTTTAAPCPALWPHFGKRRMTNLPWVSQPHLLLP